MPEHIRTHIVIEHPQTMAGRAGLFKWHPHLPLAPPACGWTASARHLAGDDAAADTDVACVGVPVTVRERPHAREERRLRPPPGHTDPTDAVSCTCSNAFRWPGRREARS